VFPHYRDDSLVTPPSELLVSEETGDRRQEENRRASPAIFRISQISRAVGAQPGDAMTEDERF
jgi:hypothetical protein